MVMHRLAVFLMVAAGCSEAGALNDQHTGGEPGNGAPPGGGAVGAAPNGGPGPDADTGAIRAEVPLPDAQRIEIGKEAAWGPAVLRVETAEFDPSGPHVQIDLGIEMVTDRTDDRLFTEVVLVWGANLIWLDTGRSQIQAVAPRRSGSARMVFPLDTHALLVPESGLGDLSQASLVLADGWTGPTVVPFGDGPAVLNVPTEFPVTGSLASPAGTVD
ncbi:MAG: hypothetical protein ACRDJ9_30250, partial [Dehalococcoidia bacterium]